MSKSRAALLLAVVAAGTLIGALIRTSLRNSGSIRAVPSEAELTQPFTAPAEELSLSPPGQPTGARGEVEGSVEMKPPAEPAVTARATTEPDYYAKYGKMGLKEAQAQLVALRNKFDLDKTQAFEAAFANSKGKTKIVPGGRWEKIEGLPEVAFNKTRYTDGGTGWKQVTVSLTPQANPELFAVYSEMDWLEKHVRSIGESNGKTQEPR